MRSSACFQPGRRIRPSSGDIGEDPLIGLANLFDVAMVFAVALLLALIQESIPPGTPSAEGKITIRRPGQRDLKAFKQRGKELEKYKISEEARGGQGRRLGVAYRLLNGQVIYVPEKRARNQRRPGEPSPQNR